MGTCNQPESSTVNQIESQMFHYTFSDCGPDFDTASRFWTDLQEGRPQDDILQLPDMMDITAGVDSIMDDLQPHRPSLPHPTPSNSTSPQPPTSPHATSPLNQNLSKLTPHTHHSNHHLSDQALLVLKNIAKRISTLEDALSSPIAKTNRNKLEEEFSTLGQSLKDIKQKGHEVVMEKEKLLLKLGELHESFIQMSGFSVYYETGDHYQIPVNAYDELTQVSLFLGVVCVVFGGLSRRFGDLIMGIINIILKLAFQPTGQRGYPPKIPHTITAALAQFNLDGCCVEYAICPACHCSYKPKTSSGRYQYPLYCENIQHPGSKICGERLIDSDELSGKPIKKFVYHEFNDYLARLLSRPDIEAMMDESSKKMRNSFKSRDVDDIAMEDGSFNMKDVFDGQFLKTFNGPSGKPFFIEAGSDHGRYIFVLHVDFFHPEGHGLHSATISCGMISMACLNLPAHLRYKPENMYACIIPGPREPSLTELNHYLRPLIDDLVVSWEKGVHFSRTASSPLGRSAKCAVGIVLCDLPAARKVAQMSPARSHIYCSRCDCKHLSTLGRVDYDKWELRDVNQLRKQAYAWKHASASEQEHIFETFGVRWSELWRLPYWHPTHQLMVDSMHCLFLGLVQYHVREVLQLREMKQSSKTVPAFKYNFKHYEHDSNMPSLKEREIQQVGQIHSLLLAPINDTSMESNDESMTDASDTVSVPEFHGDVEKLKKKLVSKNHKALAFVCNSELSASSGSHQTLSRKPSKSALADELINWRMTKPLRDMEAIQEINFDRDEVLKHVREVINLTVTPSWLNLVPHKFGSPSEGSLKADEWRSLSALYLPLALVTLWGEDPLNPSIERDPKLDQLLQHTMALFSAICIASLPTITYADAEAYRTNISTYVQNLQSLHPSANFRPNHHMAQHVYDFLLLFGPARSIWCFPFERLISMLQNLPTNHKSGELEETMTRSFQRTCSLKCWLTRPDCPKAILECKKLLDKMDSRSNLDKAKDSHTLASFSVPSISLPAKLRNSQITFSKSSLHLGNSLIEFFPKGNKSLPPVVGQITTIESANQIIFGVQLQVPAVDRILDPFQHYPYHRMKIYSSNLTSDIQYIPYDWVVGHVARYPYSPDLVVIVSLCKT